MCYKTKKMMFFNLFFLSLFFGYGCSKNKVSYEHIYVDESKLNIGEVFSSDKCKHKFTIKNVTDTSLVIERIGLECNCNSITPSENIILEPGESKEFEITIDISKQKNESLASNTDFSTSVTFIYNVLKSNESNQREVTINGIVKSNISIAPSRIIFGSVSDKISESKKTISVTSTEKVKTLFCESPTKGVIAECRRDLDDGSLNKWIINITLKIPDINYGELDCNVTILAFNDTGLCIQKKSVPIKCFKTKDVIASPQHLVFTSLSANSNYSEIIKLKSLTNRPFKITSCNCNTTHIATTIDIANDIITIQLKDILNHIDNSRIVIVISSGDGDTETIIVPISNI